MAFTFQTTHRTLQRVQKFHYVNLREVKLSCGGKAGRRGGGGVGWFRPRRGDWFSAIVVCHYANYAAGSISTLIGRFLVMQNIKGRRKPRCMKRRVWLVNSKGSEYCRQCAAQAARRKGARDFGTHCKQEVSQECFSQMYLNVFC